MFKQLENVKPLAMNVIRVLGQNPGPFTLQGTNTYIIGTGKKRILLDTGEGVDEYYNILSDTMKNNNIDSIESVIITHNHQDHVGGILDILKLCDKLPLNIYKTKPEMLTFENKNDERIKDIKVNNLCDNDIISTDGATLRVITTPGHTSDHMCIYLENNDALFTGDCVLGGGSCVFDDLLSYMQSLNKILKLPSKIIYPGHGPIVEDPKNKILEYIAHRTARENQVIEALKQLNGVATSWDIVHKVYTEVEDQRLLYAANNNVLLHLDKLVRENRVHKQDKEHYKYIAKL